MSELLSAFNLLGAGGNGGLADSLRGNIILAGNEPGLGQLQVNGGQSSSNFMPTHLPLPGSDAIDNGDPAPRYAADEFDQRGPFFERVLNGQIDIGAVETEGPAITPPILGTADVVFLLDRSGSTLDSPSQQAWTEDVLLAIETALSEQGYVDNRYALVGFARTTISDKYAFSTLIDHQLFGTAEAASRTIAALDHDGNSEDGWDAIEHAVAEYDFRPGAAVHFVLITDDQRGGLFSTAGVGTIGLNTTLTPDGDQSIPSAIAPVLAARDATLTVVAGAEFTTDSPTADVVFGVLDSPDADHEMTEYDVDTGTVLAGAFNDETDSFNAVGATENQYARLAWDTGGSAWNVEAVRQPANATVTAAFSEEFAREFAARTASQDVYVPFEVAKAIDFGGSTSTAFPDGVPPGVGGTAVSTEFGIDVTSGSIPAGSGGAFLTAIEKAAGNDMNIDLPIADGTYNVELFFSEIGTTSDRVFDVLVEGELILNDYQISEDLTRINVVDASGGPIEIARLEPEKAGFNNGAVKVIRTDVTGGVLDIDLEYVSGSQGPLLNGLRVLQMPSGPEVPGDYNVDGIVDLLDFLVWRDTLGHTVAPFAGADGDGDGVVNAGDYDVWQDHYGSTPGNIVIGLLALLPGDYNTDGIVDIDDFSLWESTFGSTTNLAADGNANGIVDLADLEVWQGMRGATTDESIAGDFNGDGVVDTADYDLWVAGDPLADADGDQIVLGDQDDYDIWEANFGTVHASMLPMIMNVGSGASLEVPDAAPIVLAMAVSATGANPYYFNGVVGSGEQLRTAPVAGANTVSIKFSEEVFVTQNALSLTNLDGTSPATVTSFEYDLGMQTATWTFDSAFADGRTLLRLFDSVYDLDQEALDGEFWGPWSLADSGTAVFPSGDGDAGGEFRFRFTMLAGDTDRDNIDGSTDYTEWHTTEPGMVHVSTTVDELDADLSLGDVSLREAVQHANGASEATTIVVPAGFYEITRLGTEVGDASQGDFDITGDVAIAGAGPGLTIFKPGEIEEMGVDPQDHGRVFHVEGTGARLDLSRVTITGTWNSGSHVGAAALVKDHGELVLTDSAVADVGAWGTGVAISSQGADLTIRRSVFTNNLGQDRIAVEAEAFGATTAA